MTDRTQLLVISPGTRVYREYLLRSLEQDFDVWLFTDREPSWETPYVVGHRVLDTTDTEAMVRAAKPLSCQGVLTWDDTRVVQAAMVAHGLGLPTSPPEAVLRCRDKHQTREALRKAGVPQAASVLTASLAEARAAAQQVGYPLVLKPRALNASTGVVHVNGPDQLAKRFRVAKKATAPGVTDTAPGDVLVEEYLDGQEISLDAAWHEGQMSLAFVARKRCGFPPYFEEVGHLVDGGDPLAEDHQVRDVVAGAHAAVGFTTGWTHTELRLTADGPKVVEINARIGGDRIPDVARLATGVRAAPIAAAVVCGSAPAVWPDHRRVAAIQFLYPERDCIVRSVRVDAGRLPSTVDAAEVVAEVGQELVLPPAGHVSSRYALLTVVGDSEQECLTDLDNAAAAIQLEILQFSVKLSARGKMRSWSENKSRTGRLLYPTERSGAGFVLLCDQSGGELFGTPIVL